MFIHSIVLELGGILQSASQAEVILGVCCSSIIVQSECIAISWLCPLFVGDTAEQCQACLLLGRDGCQAHGVVMESAAVWLQC